MCSLLCTKIWKLLIFELARNLRFFVLKHVKCVSEDDVLYDNQLIINPILVRRFTPSSMWIKNLFSRRSAAVVVREIQDECIFIVYDFCNPPPPPINFVPVCAQLFIFHAAFNSAFYTGNTQFWME